MFSFFLILCCLIPEVVAGFLFVAVLAITENVFIALICAIIMFVLLKQALKDDEEDKKK